MNACMHIACQNSSISLAHVTAVATRTCMGTFTLPARRHAAWCIFVLCPRPGHERQKRAAKLVALAAEAAPFGPLALRALDAHSEPVGSRTSPMGLRSATAAKPALQAAAAPRA